MLKDEAYKYIIKEDEHIENILRWMNSLEDIRRDIEESEMDYDLASEISKIKSSLREELGERFMHIFC